MTILQRATALLAIIFLFACTAPDSGQDMVEAGQDAIPHAQLPGDVIPLEYRLDMRMDPDADAFTGTVEIDVNIVKPTRKVWLHGKAMQVDRAEFTQNGEITALEFNSVPLSEAPSGIAFLQADGIIPAGKATLSMDYETPFNRSLYSAYKTERGDDAYIVTQFEPIGAREAFPGFDEPRFKVPFTISITSPAEDFVYANTPETSSEVMDDGWVKHEFARTRPLPTYLIAFGAGPYDVVDFDPLPATEVRDREIELRGIAARGEGRKMAYSLENTAGILEAIENYFGIPYPYEKLDLIAAPEYAFGAMENPGAIVYREYLLLMDDNAPLRQKRSYAGTHSHELAHQWFGNLVTPVWWGDIWLNEAFATWMGNKGTSIWQPEGNFDRRTLNAALGAMNIDALSSTRKIREPLHRSENVMDQFDSITYRKGGGVLSMFESYIGEENFQKGVRLHMDRFADDVATADDFFQSLADGAENPAIVSALKSFVDQPGLPLVSADIQCSKAGTEVSLRQSRYAPLGSKITQDQTWEIPVCMAYADQDGERAKQCTLLKDESAKLQLDADLCSAWATLNADGAGYYRFALPGENWKTLLQNLDKLTTKELLTVQDSLDAAFSAGTISAEVYIAGMRAFAASSEFDVASNAGRNLVWFHKNLGEETRGGLAELTRDMYGARYADIAGTDSIQGDLLAPTLASRLINYGQDSALAADFAARGIVYLGLDEEADKKAVAQNLLRLALAEAFKARGEAAYGPLLDLVQNGSSFERSAALGALSSAPTPELAERLRAEALNETGALTGRQASSLIYELIESRQHQGSTWSWLKANFKDFVESRIPDVRVGRVPGYAGSFCSLELRDDAKAFFKENAALIPGYERSLAQNMEAIELCAALKSATQDELTARFTARD